MNPHRISIFKSIGTAFRIIKRSFLDIILFELVYKTLSLLLFKPALKALLQLMLNVSGHRVALNENIAGFFLSIPGVLAAALVLMCASVVVFFEFAVIIYLVYGRMRDTGNRLGGALRMAFWSLPCLKGPGVIGFAIYTLVLLPATNIGLSSSLWPQWGLPKFVSGEVAKMAFAQPLLLIGSLLMFTIFFAMIFTLPSMVLEKKRFGRAVKQNTQVLKKTGVQLLFVQMVFMLAGLLLIFLPKTLSTIAFGAPNINLLDLLLAYKLSWKAMLAVFLQLFAILAQTMLMPCMMSVLVVVYVRVSGTAQLDVVGVPRLGGKMLRVQEKLHDMAQRLYGRFGHGGRTFFIRNKRVIAVVCAALLAAGLVYLYAPASALHRPMVIGHRGSLAGVENTLEAIQGGIDAGVSYIEIDILLSKDGVPMVIHDAHLQRLAGRNEYVYELTAQELQGIPLKQNGYVGHIPTLAQAIELCKGSRSQIMIEYKLHGYEERSVVQSVMEVMQKNNYGMDCLYQSLEYNLVAEMKRDYPTYKAGYCLYGNVGTLSTKRIRSLDVDFIVVEEGLASRQLMKNSTKAWVPVYVWTVNERGDMDKYLRMGALGLVSDQPETAAQAVSVYEKQSFFANLLPQGGWGQQREGDILPDLPDISGQ